MFERMFVLVSGLCDIKELSVLVSHQVWFMHVSPAPFRKEKGGGEEEGKNTPVNKAIRRDTLGQLCRVMLCESTQQRSMQMWPF